MQRQNIVLRVRVRTFALEWFRGVRRGQFLAMLAVVLCAGFSYESSRV